MISITAAEGMLGYRHLMRPEDRFRMALAALQAYCEDRNNPLAGPRFEKLVNEMFAAMDALATMRHKRAA